MSHSTGGLLLQVGTKGGTFQWLSDGRAKEGREVVVGKTLEAELQAAQIKS